MSMQGPSNLSNACTSMTVMEQRWKQDCLSKRIPNINLVFELRTQTFSSTHLGLRLQQKPQKQKSCFWFPSVLLLGETRLMKYKLDLKDKHRSQIHTTVVLKDDLKATCDKYRPYTEKIENLPWGSSSASPTSTWSSTPAHAPGFWNLTASYQTVAGFWMAAHSSTVHDTSKEQKRMTTNTDHLLT